MDTNGKNGGEASSGGLLGFNGKQCHLGTGKILEIMGNTWNSFEGEKHGSMVVEARLAFGKLTVCYGKSVSK